MYYKISHKVTDLPAVTPAQAGNTEKLNIIILVTPPSPLCLCGKRRLLCLQLRY